MIYDRTLQFLILIFLPVTMVGGLAAATLVSLIMLVMLYKYHHLYFDQIFSYKMLWCFILWCLITCIWAPNALSSYLILCKVFVMILSAVFLTTNFSQNTKAVEFISCIRAPIYIGICSAILVFFIETYSNGLFTKLFILTTNDTDKVFQTHFLDRGCAILTVMTWFCIYLLIDEGKRVHAFILYIIVLLVLILSDSLASCLAFICSGMVFAILIISKMRLWKVIFGSLILVLLSTPYVAYKEEPDYLSKEYCSSVPSAAHRLFIWSFVSNKIIEKPILGYGFNSSRYLSEGKTVQYGEYEFGLLPLHPHNNILQVFLETGVIGYLLYIICIIQMVAAIFTSYDEKQIHQVSVMVASVVSYLCIGMISFSVWQLWWVATGVLLFMLMQIVRKANMKADVL